MSKLAEPKWDKEYKNAAEAQFASIARSMGWKVTKQGWPDFICFDQNGKLILVEVKKSRAQRLKKSQHMLMNILGDRYNVPCYKWSPDNDWLSGPQQRDLVKRYKALQKQLADYLQNQAEDA